MITTWLKHHLPKDTYPNMAIKIPTTFRESTGFYSKTQLINKTDVKVTIGPAKEYLEHGEAQDKDQDRLQVSENLVGQR